MSSARLQVQCRLRREKFELDAALDLPLRGITGIFGPSGAGKTTLLRCVAGLERPDTGRVSLGAEVWQDDAAGEWRPVPARQVGYVFQEARLFRHLTVRDNLLYGARRSGSAGASVDFDGVTSLLGIAHLLERRPLQLSGGEAQRVAIARALLRAPRLVLMDEPLASLDRARREEILPFLDRLHAELETPILYVSHNIEEIGRLCDHLVVLEDGRVVAAGELQSVLVRTDIASLGGDNAGATIVGEVVAYDADYQLTELRIAGGTLTVAGPHGQPGARLRIRIRANDISLCRERPSDTTILNLLEATILHIEPGNDATSLLRLDVGGDALLARVTRRSCAELKLEAGSRVIAQVKAVAVRAPQE